VRAAAIAKAGWRHPAGVLEAFADEPWTIGLLADAQRGQGRWSYVARAPDRVLQVGRDDACDAFDDLRDLLGPLGPTVAGGPPFQGGVVGLACYELGDRVERLGLRGAPGWPDLAVGRYPRVLAFDHVRREVISVGRGRTQTEADAAARSALAWLQAPSPPHEALEPSPLMACDPRAYEAAVGEVIRRIGEGEIFQANIARAWSGPLSGRPWALFAQLLARSPAPFAAYFRLDGLAVVSNSPERFLRADAQGCVETRPIKGTRPRSDCPIRDAQYAAELLASDKDRAENLMIVDLMRNDLARVCRAGSVRVPELFQLESFANVHHLVSIVTGVLAAENDALGLFEAAFPPGSITGAPKIQAMRVIAALEPPRGPYCGSMFWAGADGAFDSSVLIRTAACRLDREGWRVEVRAGAGVVADSDPAAERAETEAKISAFRHALVGERMRAAGANLTTAP
jgi:para-aminobenzoate synthetase component 1